MGIVEEDIARVRDATDIVAVITQYTQLRKVGQRWTGLCPFHAEKSPSFSVNPADKLYLVDGNLANFADDFPAGTLTGAKGTYPAVDPATITMRGIPPLGVCTVCIGKTTTGWSNHFGIVRKLEGADFVYRGE